MKPSSEVGRAVSGCQISSRLGIQHLMATAYHQRSNGLVERFHRQLKDALGARLAGVHWVKHLPWVLLGLRVSQKRTVIYPL